MRGAPWIADGCVCVCLSPLQVGDMERYRLIRPSDSSAVLGQSGQTLAEVGILNDATVELRGFGADLHQVRDAPMQEKRLGSDNLPLCNGRRLHQWGRLALSFSFPPSRPSSSFCEGGGEGRCSCEALGKRQGEEGFCGGGDNEQNGRVVQEGGRLSRKGGCCRGGRLSQKGDDRVACGAGRFGVPPGALRLSPPSVSELCSG